MAAPEKLREEVASAAPLRILLQEDLVIRGGAQLWLTNCGARLSMAGHTVMFLLAADSLILEDVTALAGGAAYGFSAGIFGVGGAVRGAFLSAYDLPKSVYIFTAGAIGLAIDSGRIVTYIWQGAALDTALLWGLAIFVPVSFIGAKLAERLVDRIPQERFRSVVAMFLGLVALQLLLFPGATSPRG